MNTISLRLRPAATYRVPDSIARPLMISLFAAGTALGAYVRVPLPFTPVPLTLQTFFVLAAGIMLGGRGGVWSQLM